MRIINKTKEKEKDKTMDSYLTSNKYDVRFIEFNYSLLKIVNLII